MVTMTINQVEYSNSHEGPVIHLFGRNKKGVAERVDVTGFRPYFYIPEEQAKGMGIQQSAALDENTQYKSIRGEPLRRIYTRSPKDVAEVREKFRHYEADIPFGTRFMIDMGLTGAVTCPGERVSYKEIKPAELDSPSRVCMIDIECNDQRGFPDPERDEILCITCWDSFEKAYVTFLLAPGADTGEKFFKKYESGKLENGCFDDSLHTTMIYVDETAMMRDFASYICDRNPDILSGWNFAGFDLPYIMGRMEKLGLPVSSMARMPGQSDRVVIRGRAIFDLLLGYQKMHLTRKESYRLDAIAEEELGQHKVRYTGTIHDLWRNETEKFVEYNFKDVELCVLLNKKDSIIEFFRELARYVGCPLDRTTSSSAIIDIYVLRKAYGRMVLPSKGNSVGDKFEGATVFEPSRGIRENVIVLDLKSLYPMAMMTINASLDTKDPKGELVAPNGIRFKKAPDGLARGIIMELLAERDTRKAMRNKYAFGSREYEVLDMQQAVIKVIMNTYYGVSGNERFRLSDREIGAAITSVGRAILEHTRKVLESLGYGVVYGDTDSCMVQLPAEFTREQTIAEAKRLEGILNKSYQDFAEKELNANVHYFSTKFEKIYTRFFQAGKKKRYAGLLTWKEGKDVREVDLVGFELKRSDTPRVTKVVQKDVMTMILDGEKFEKVKLYLADVLRKYRARKYPLDEIGIPGGIGKSLADYENADAQIRGAIYANTYFHAGFGKGSKPKRIYIKTVTGKYPRTDVICFEYGDQVPKEFVMDTELMLEKTLKNPISRITDALGWNWMDIDPTMTTLGQYGEGSTE
jgi:DNA polymerase I